jgi:hypothetical protein
MTEERKLVDVLNGTRTDIVREVRAADSIIYNLISGAMAGAIKPENVLALLRQARRHLAKVTD